MGIYGAVLRAGQALFLFITSVSLTFSPFVADLHHRGEREQLDALYKNVTRWTLAATIPVLLVLGILPAQTLRIFGPDFTSGADALRILIIGMAVNVTVGTVGFILIMAGRTGWDLTLYLCGFAIDVGFALALAGPNSLGIRGAAIAQAATLTFSAVARLLLVRRFLGIWPFDRKWLRLAVPALLGRSTMGLVHAVMPEGKWALDLLVSAALGTAVYGAAMLAVGLSPTERAAVTRLPPAFHSDLPSPTQGGGSRMTKKSGRPSEEGRKIPRSVRSCMQRSATSSSGSARPTIRCIPQAEAIVSSVLTLGT